MKKTTIFILSLLLTCSVFAQNNQGKADDGARISITPVVSDHEIPQGAKNMLVNKMKQICSKNGMAGDGLNPFFVMDASVDVLSKELTPTAPPMHALNLTINLEIKDMMSGNVYSQTSIDVKGVGKNETKAYSAGIKQLNTSSGQFKAFVEKGKERILEFYNSECDLVLSKASALHKQGDNGEAIKVLKSVPPVSKECYDKCMELLAQIEPPVEEPKEESAEGAAAGTSAVAANGSTNLGEVEIADQVFLVFNRSKVLGSELKLYFVFDNRGAKDFEMKDYVLDTRIIDGSGNEQKLERAFMGGNQTSSYIKATLINGIPTPIEFRFPNVAKVAMFEFYYDNNAFRIKNLPLTTN